MNNNNFKKEANIDSLLLNQIPLIKDNIIQPPQNQFNLPLYLNQPINTNQNIQYPILPFLLPDQFLYQNQLFLLQRLLLVPPQQQINYLNQLIAEQNLRNINNIIQMNNINSLNNNALNTQEINNNLNENYMRNVLNNIY